MKEKEGFPKLIKIFLEEYQKITNRSIRKLFIFKHYFLQTAVACFKCQ